MLSSAERTRKRLSMPTATSRIVLLALRELSMMMVRATVYAGFTPSLAWDADVLGCWVALALVLALALATAFVVNLC